jgi:hypothetical protein
MLELNEAWRQGGEELFCPYGKTDVQTLGTGLEAVLPSTCMLVAVELSVSPTKTSGRGGWRSLKCAGRGRPHSDRSCLEHDPEKLHDFSDKIMRRNNALEHERDSI